MEKNKRYDRYQDDDNRSSDYRQQNRSMNRDYDSNDAGQSRYQYRPDPYSSDYYNQRGYRGGQYQGNDWQENNWKTGESNPYRSGQDYDWHRGYQQNDRRYAGERNEGWNNPDRSQYRTTYDRSERDYDSNDRGWWDKTSDEVSSWFGNDDAKRRRRMDQLNEENHYGKGPKNYKRSQEKIKEDVNERLSEDPYVDASDIEVEVSDTEVTLSGTVNSRQAKRRAEDVVDRISGITHVQNNLRVNNFAGAQTTGSASYEPRNENQKTTVASSGSSAGSSSTTNGSRANKEQLHN